MHVIDFHSHFFSRPFFEGLAELSPLDDPLEKIEKDTPIELPPADVGAHTKRWLKELESKGVDHLVAFASLPREIPAVAEAAAQSGGKITPIAFVNPKAGGDIRPLLDTQGFAGALVFPAMHHFHIADHDAMLAHLDERGAILYVHCGLLVVKLRDILKIPRPYDLKYANPLGLIPAANKYKNIRFVIPHFGAGFFRETLMVGTQCENVYVDTSSTNSWIKTQANDLTLRDVFRRTLDVFGAQRILFGTDSNVFPAGWRKDRFDEQRSIVESLELPGPDQEAIFWGNASRLLRGAGATLA